MRKHVISSKPIMKRLFDVSHPVGQPLSSVLDSSYREAVAAASIQKPHLPHGRIHFIVPKQLQQLLSVAVTPKPSEMNQKCK